MKPKISVIVPVFNVERFLAKCLDSLVAQTLKEIEIVIVNDGSSDSSGAIIDSYARQHSNIVVVNKVNGGLASARNEGVKAATAAYVAFVDSDDWIAPEMMADMLAVAEKETADIVCCNLVHVMEDTGEHVLINKNVSYREVAGHDAAAMMLDDVVTNCVCDKIYKRTLFEGPSVITFPEGLYYEDVPTNLQLFLSAGKAVFMPDNYYFYLQRDASITKVFSDKGVTDYVEILLLMQRKINSGEQYGYLQLPFEHFKTSACFNVIAKTLKSKMSASEKQWFFALLFRSLADKGLLRGNTVFLSDSRLKAKIVNFFFRLEKSKRGKYLKEAITEIVARGYTITKRIV